MSKYVGKIVTNQAPAGYSVFFNGSGNYLSVASNAAFAMGTGNFTVEFWARPTTSSGYGYLFQIGDFSTGIWIFRNSGSTKVVVGTLTTDKFTQTSTPAVDTWNHYALVRSSNTLTLYFNGIADGSVTVTGENYTSNTLRIAGSVAGFEYTGYISNFRIIKGTALYTAAFTPPTQLLNVTNTSILTCNSPAIIDQSSNAFAITTNGNAAVSTFTPFAAYNPVPTTANPLIPAPGVWTLDEALQYTQQGVWPSPITNAIEDVFSTYLYTGNSSTQTITNGIDLSGKGGLVWLKGRNQAYNNNLFDTARGTQNRLNSNTTGAAVGAAGGVTSFNTNGFTLDSGVGYNDSPNTFVSWTFRKQAKFFDVVTYTGNGASGARAIAHNLGSTPGCYIVKRTDSTSFWPVYHRMMNGGTNPHNYWMALESTSGQALNTAYFGAAPTSTNFYVADNINANGGTYVAYLFAHDAGGFGPAGTDNVISCGSFTTDGGSSFTAVNLGYEPQWLLIKASSGTSNWTVVDNMRGIPVGSNGARLIPNLSDAETSTFSWANLTATGFGPPTGGSNPYAASTTYIYIAIRRGPMRPPTSGTSVYNAKTYSGTNTTNSQTGLGFPPDITIFKGRNSATSPTWTDRLRGQDPYITSDSTAAEASATLVGRMDMDGFTTSSSYSLTNQSGINYIGWCLRRAPGFFDEVCYTGTSANRTVTHNLTVAPELMIVRIAESGQSGSWFVYAGNDPTSYLVLNTTAAKATLSTVWNNTAPTNSVFSVGTNANTNASGIRLVAYLFATVGGISKVGSYTGSGTTQQINCGFTNGSRFVMIKRTDSTGDWYVWDSARGIVAGNDPYLLLNSTAAEVTGTDYVDTYSAGFELSSTAPAALNASGGTYIFLAIA